MADLRRGEFDPIINEDKGRRTEWTPETGTE